MTLILALGNSDQMIQLSDRRLSWDGQVVEDEASKAGLLICLNARLVFGFTGLAKAGDFKTRDWLLDAIQDCGPPAHDHSLDGILERLRIRATETFCQHADLRGLQRKDKRLSIMFSGYMHAKVPPLLAFALLSNYQNFETDGTN